MFALTEIKTWCDLGCQGLVEFLFVFDGWIQTKINHLVSSRWKIETWVLCTIVVICHCPKLQIVKGVMTGVVLPSAFKVSSYFVQGGYVHHVPKPLWDIWHQNTLKNMKATLSVWLKNGLWAAGSHKPGANAAAVGHPMHLPKESGRGLGCLQSSASVVQWLLYIYYTWAMVGMVLVICHVSSLKYGNQTSSCRKHPCKWKIINK